MPGREVREGAHARSGARGRGARLRASVKPSKQRVCKCYQNAFAKIRRASAESGNRTHSLSCCPAGNNCAEQSAFLQILTFPTLPKRAGKLCIEQLPADIYVLRLILFCRTWQKKGGNRGPRFGIVSFRGGRAARRRVARARFERRVLRVLLSGCGAPPRERAASKRTA